MKIHLDQLIPNPKNRELNEEKVLEYMASIRLNGLLQDPLVQPLDDDTYMILSGHHRIAAYRRLAKENPVFRSIECKVASADLDSIHAEMALIDGNLNSPLSAYEKVMAIGRKEELLKELANDHKHELGKGKGTLRDIIAAQISLQSTQVGKYLRIYKRSCNEVLKALKANDITVEQASIICKFPLEQQPQLLHSQSYKNKIHSNDIFLEDLRVKLQQRLDTKVHIQSNKLEISYTDTDDLNRILEQLQLIEDEES